MISTNTQLNVDVSGISRDLIGDLFLQGSISLDDLPSMDTEVASDGFRHLLRVIDQVDNRYLSLYSQSKSVLCRVNLRNKTIDRITRHSGISGLSPKNREQSFALDALLDPNLGVVTITGAAGSGKAQPLDSNVLTPTGWHRMGNILPNDIVCTPSGDLATVLEVFPQGTKKIYRVVFSDGSITRCCIEHLWKTQTSAERKNNLPAKLRTTSAVSRSLKSPSGYNHSIPLVSPYASNALSLEPLAVDPYFLGACIASDMPTLQPTIKTSNQWVVSKCNDIISEHARLLSCVGDVHQAIFNQGQTDNLGSRFRSLKLRGLSEHTKRIPPRYLSSPAITRILLLQGILDVAGVLSRRTVNSSKYSITISSRSSRFLDGVRTLVQSLGGIGIMDVSGGRFYLHICLPRSIDPFSDPTLMANYLDSDPPDPVRYITEISHVSTEEAQCLYIDHPDHEYITDEFVVTHNTILTLASGLDGLEQGKYDKIVLTKPMSQTGKYQLGTLPGDSSEKFRPYLRNYLDNLEVLIGDQAKRVDTLFDFYNIDLVPFQLIRGASFRKALVIADEIQVLRPADILTLGTRISEGSKLVLLGDLDQRDESIAKKDTGIYQWLTSQIADKSHLTASITLTKCERSEISRLFSRVFNG